MQKAIVILGQTATGKSALAVKIAKKIKGEIISADSRQVYKGLDIGAGKVTKKEMSGIRHHLLDVASPKLKFSVTQYQKLVARAMTDIIDRGKIPIICGGTGFYIDAITKGSVFPEVPPNPKLRKELGKKSAQDLFQILKTLDRSRAKNIDPKNPVRLLRAIEIAVALGKVPKIKAKKPKYEFIKLGLFLPYPKLHAKVSKRVKKMFRSGLIKEIERLKKSGVSDTRLQEFGFEYWQPTEIKVIQETIKYAKRQMTWFKRDPEVEWFDASQKIEPKAIKFVEEALSQ